MQPVAEAAYVLDIQTGYNQSKLPISMAVCMAANPHVIHSQETDNFENRSQSLGQKG